MSDRPVIFGPPSYWKRAPWWKRMVGTMIVPDERANRAHAGELVAYDTNPHPVLRSDLPASLYLPEDK